MAKVNIYNWEGQVVGAKDLSPEVFELKANSGLIHEVVTGLQANRRQVLAHTKTRGEVSGGGKKPWKQKGTGRARHGSIRSPLWRGGGIIFGPRKDRNFKVKINKQIKSQVFKMILSQKVADGRLLLVENSDFPTNKTKAFAKFLHTLSLTGRKVLLALPKESDKNLKLASRNVARLKQVDLGSLNVLEMLSGGTLIASQSAAEHWEKVYTK